MKKSISKNYIYNTIYQILTLIAPLITTPYVARVLSVDSIGIYSYTYSIAAFFMIFAELGSATYARREIAYCQDDKDRRSIVFWEILILRIITTCISLIIYYIYILNSTYFKIGIIQMLYIVAVIFDITWFYQGMEDFKSIVIRNSVIKLFIIIFIFIFVKTENDLMIYVFGLVLLPLIGNIITWMSLRKYVKKINIKNLKPFIHLKGTFVLFIPNIASQIYLLLDKTMLGILTIDNIENGYYEQAQKIIRLCWTFLTTFSAVITPRIAFIYKKNDKENMKKYIRYALNFILLLSSLLCFGIIATSDSIIPWFLGNAYDKVITLLIIFAFILYPIGITSITGTAYLVTIKKQKIYTISIIVGAILNIILNFFLIPRYYSIGAAISSVIVEYVIAIIQIIYVCYIIKDIKLKDIYINIWQYLLSGIIMTIILRNISKFLANTIFNSILLIIIGIIIYFLILIILKNKLIIEEINKIKTYIKNKY